MVRLVTIFLLADSTRADCYWVLASTLIGLGCSDDEVDFYRKKAIELAPI